MGFCSCEIKQKKEEEKKSEKSVAAQDDVCGCVYSCVKNGVEKVDYCGAMEKISQGVAEGVTQAKDMVMSKMSDVVKSYRKRN